MNFIVMSNNYAILRLPTNTKRKLMDILQYIIYNIIEKTKLYIIIIK